jgi:hypothetical protein
LPISQCCAPQRIGCGLIWVARLSAVSCTKDRGCKPYRCESGPAARVWRHVAHAPTPDVCRCVLGRGCSPGSGVGVGSGCDCRGWRWERLPRP